MKSKVSILFLITGILFAACMLIANTLAAKIIQIGPWSAPAGVLIFPIAYVINDLIVEVWGYARARLIIWTGFGVNMLAAIFYTLSIIIPSAPFYEGQEAYSMIVGSSVRIVIASLTAYLTGSFLNAYVMSRLKRATSGKGFSFRAVFSTILGESADSLIFITVAFAGVFPLSVILTMIATQAAMKIAYELLILPVTVVVVRKVKEIEGIDVVDNSISYNPFKLKEI